MDALLLMQPTIQAVGYDGRGDYQLGPDGRLERRPEVQVAPYVFTGVQMLHPRLFAACPEGPFSMNVLYDKAEEEGRLFGLRHQGDWLHIGTAAGLAEAEAFLKGG
jgi:MurNAc alpha-1-phosphate uridylyltransferase